MQRRNLKKGKPDSSKRKQSYSPAHNESEPVAAGLNVIVSEEARQSYLSLRRSDPVRFEKVTRTLEMLAVNPRHPSLNSHEYKSKRGPGDTKLWESYVENKTPAAYRIFWHYGPDPRTITVLAITPHP